MSNQSLEYRYPVSVGAALAVLGLSLLTVQVAEARGGSRFAECYNAAKKPGMTKPQSQALTCSCLRKTIPYAKC